MRRREFMGRGMAALVVGVASPRLYSSEGPPSRTPSPFDALLAEETRLYANENPYGPPPEARAAMDDVLGYANRYGSYGTNGRLMEPSELEARIAARESVAADHVLVTHGATSTRDVRVGSAMQRDSTRIRLTIGTDAEIDRFLAALRAVLA